MVLESVLQGFLQKQFGKYLENFDKQQINVGIWHGNIELKNMRINRDVLNSLDLPVKMKFGIINKLTMNVPWTSLSTSPVIVNLDGLYIILEPQKKEKWKPIRTASLQEKETILNTFTQNLLKQLEGEPEEAKGQKGQSYIQKLTMRIVDNLQFTVKNIHIRYQDQIFSNQPFAFGITLKGLDVFTTNDQWEQQFFDRTKPQNKEKPMRKRLKLTDFSIYLEDKVHRMLTKQGDFDNEDFAQKSLMSLKMLIPGQQNKSEDQKKEEQHQQDKIVDLVNSSIIRPSNFFNKLLNAINFSKP